MKKFILSRAWLREPIFRGREKLVRILGNCQLRLRSRGEPCKIIVAAAGRVRKGWISTDQSSLDLLNPEKWQRFFEKGAVQAISAEHVWEHLTPAQGLAAAKTCFSYLAPAGVLRIAVPDGYHPSPNYIAYVDINGTGPSANDHKILYNWQSLTALLEKVGFKVTLLEHFDSSGEFHYVPWNPEDGYIYRSKRFMRQDPSLGFDYTSLIVDAVKP